MIPGFEKVNLSCYVQQPAGNGEQKAAEKKSVSIPQPAKLTGALAGLAVLGYVGVRAFRGKATEVKPQEVIQETLPQECVIKVQNWLNSIKKMPAKIWVQEDDGGKIREHTINNPVAKDVMEAFLEFTPAEKKVFVQEYCNMTGFPDLKKVNENINQEIMTALDKMVKGTDNKVLFAAYDRNCSVGRGRALPGSDCDGLFVVIEKPCSEYVNRGVLGDSINQRLIETTGSHYPEVFCLEDLKGILQEVEGIAPRILSPEKIAGYEKNISYDGNSYVQAAQFNIDLAEHIPDKYKKDMVCEAGFFVEMLRGGKVLVNNLSDEVLEFLKGTSMYKYSNLTRQEGLSGKTKPKLEKRIEFCRSFEEMNDEEKFKVCIDLLKKSFGLKTEDAANGAFEYFDMGDIIEMYKKVSSFFG